MKLTEDDVLEILRLIDESEFNELRLEEGDFKLFVRKRGKTECFPQSEVGLKREACLDVKTTLSVERGDCPAGNHGIESETYGSTKIGEQKNTSGEIISPAEGQTLIAIKSPMMGTFYRKANPNSPPFVEVGTFIREGDSVCVIEVMKLFSTIKAEVRGRIVKICAESGQLVEYKQTLFQVAPAEPEEVSQEKVCS